MSSELRELYQEVILDHGRRPRNFRKLDTAKHAEGFNPLCGDKVTVYADVEGGRIRDLAFQGSGCAISTASASMMTEALKGKAPAEAEELFEKFHALVTGNADPEASAESVGKLAVFSGVSEFPVRVKCATLAWHTLRAALEGCDDPVSTE
ncbi:MAG: nitrogen fixation protein NifU [Candidatus Binatota bacterium]|nr:nitrogen fixation protein NifU [Candidatus Binatota bacterium]